ncbi:MAG: pantoate--beta-alanine ligase, partial [Balneolales bacterium]|nr:pantoate--beta-alanine ligase [Balneolales bacterium]
HFNGVLQIVNKLFNIVQPTDAWFGQKDIQQLILLETMVREFNIPVHMHRGKTIREADGLAMSSRNRYLSAQERTIAPQLYAEITSIRDYLKHGGNITAEDLDRTLAAARYRLTEIGFKIDYLSIVDVRNLQPQQRVYSDRTYIIAVAAKIGNTRLIDNIIF